MFLMAIMISKAAVFVAVVIFTLLLTRPMNFSKAGLFAIFCTQSNDFALGYPIGEWIVDPRISLSSRTAVRKTSLDRFEWEQKAIVITRREWRHGRVNRFSLPRFHSSSKHAALSTNFIPLLSFFLSLPLSSLCLVHLSSTFPVHNNAWKVAHCNNYSQMSILCPTGSDETFR